MHPSNEDKLQSGKHYGAFIDFIGRKQPKSPNRKKILRIV